MTHTFARLAGLATILAALTFAPPSMAAGLPAPGITAKAKQYAKDCGSKAKRGRDAAPCIKALNKLATGKSSSPRAACARVSHKRAKGVRGKSSFARCVTAGSKVVKDRKNAERKAGEAADESTDDAADDGADDGSTDPGESEADEPLADVSIDVSLGEDADVADLPDGS